MEITQDSLEKATNTFVVAQIVITLVLAISLKSMWNLYNVVQVLAYIRFYSAWPALMMELFTQMDNAITLKPITDPIFEYGQTQFEKANVTLYDEHEECRCTRHKANQKSRCLCSGLLRTSHLIPRSKLKELLAEIWDCGDL